jgi:DNA-binding GntR family transcriptional regulator
VLYTAYVSFDTRLDSTTEVPESSLAPPEQKLLSRSVADWLATRIIAGELTPGERLHETKVAEDARVSRSPVREALRLLAGEGLVELIPRVGARVAQVGAEHASDLYATRLLIEPACIRSAVEAMTTADAQALDDLHNLMEEAIAARDPRAFLDHNVDYYRRLIAPCPNSVLRELVELAWTKSLRYWSVLIRLENYAAASVERNRLLNHAVQTRDPAGAEVAAGDVLRQALEEMLAAFEHRAPAAQEERRPAS